MVGWLLQLRQCFVLQPGKFSVDLFLFVFLDFLFGFLLGRMMYASLRWKESFWNCLGVKEGLSRIG